MSNKRPLTNFEKGQILAGQLGQHMDSIGENEDAFKQVELPPEPEKSGGLLSAIKAKLSKAPKPPPEPEVKSKGSYREVVERNKTKPNEIGSLTEVLTKGGKVSQIGASKADTKLEKIWINKDGNLVSNKTKNRQLLSYTYETWFALPSVWLTAFFILPLIVVLLLKGVPWVNTYATTGISLTLPFIGPFSASGRLLNFLFTLGGFLGFAWMCLKYNRRGTVMNKYESKAFFELLYDSSFLRTLVVLYLGMVEFSLNLLMSPLGFIAGLGLSLLAVFSFLFGAGDWIQMPFNPLLMCLMIGCGVLWEKMFMTPMKPCRRRFGLSQDYKEFILKDSYIPYRYYEEKPRDLVPSLTFYIFFVLRLAFSVLANVFAWVLNKFQLRKLAVVLYPVVWFYDLLEIIVLDSIWFILNCINWFLGKAFLLLGWLVFLSGLVFNTYRMYMLEKNFTLGGLVINILLVIFTFLLFVHFYHTAKFFKAYRLQTRER